jgi:hypothetical protein
LDWTAKEIASAAESTGGFTKYLQEYRLLLQKCKQEQEINKVKQERKVEAFAKSTH